MKADGAESLPGAFFAAGAGLGASAAKLMLIFHLGWAIQQQFCAYLVAGM